jgi:hypothetical protein
LSLFIAGCVNIAMNVRFQARRLLAVLMFVGGLVFAQSAGNLINLSARLRVPAGGVPAIAGFAVETSSAEPVPVLIRAVGPGLASFNVAGAVANPRLALLNASGQTVASNDDWGSAAGAAERAAAVGAFALAPESRDAALAVALKAGTYSVHASDGEAGSGIVLIEIYAAGASGRFVNLSVRGATGAGADTLTAGFAISGGLRPLLVRGIGPALTSFGVAGAIADPRVTLFNANGARIGENDNWQSARDPNGLEVTMRQVGAFALAPGADAALAVSAANGSFTAQVADAASRSGEALLEIYALTGAALLRHQVEESWGRGLAAGRGTVALTVAPMSAADVGQFQPLGLTAGAHVTPIDHCYFYPADLNRPRGSYEVLAPAAGRITQIQHRTQLAGTTETQRDYDDYRVIIAHTGSFFSYFDLIDVMDAGIVAQISGGLVRGGTTLCNVPVVAGQIVGRIGARSLDFGVVDTERPLSGFVNAEHYLREPWKLFTQDPLAAFAEPARGQILAKSLRTAPPLGGKIDYDVRGRLVGNWFREGTNGYAGAGDPRGYWIGHLAIFPHFLDPSVTVISFGDYNAGGPRSFAARVGSREAATVSAAEGAVRFELINMVRPSGAQPLQGSDGVVQGTVLFEVLDGDRLRMEMFPGRPAVQVMGFTPAAMTYER